MGMHSNSRVVKETFQQVSSISKPDFSTASQQSLPSLKNAAPYKYEYATRVQESKHSKTAKAAN